MAFNLFSENKIIINNKQKMTIENFRLIKEYKRENIIIDNISVKGINLHINEINDYVIEISGIIKEIIFV